MNTFRTGPGRSNCASRGEPRLHATMLGLKRGSRSHRGCVGRDFQTSEDTEDKGRRKCFSCLRMAFWLTVILAVLPGVRHAVTSAGVKRRCEIQHGRCCWRRDGGGVRSQPVLHATPGSMRGGHAGCRRQSVRSAQTGVKITLRLYSEQVPLPTPSPRSRAPAASARARRAQAKPTAKSIAAGSPGYPVDPGPRARHGAGRVSVATPARNLEISPSDRAALLPRSAAFRWPPSSGSLIAQRSPICLPRTRFRLTAWISTRSSTTSRCWTSGTTAIAI